jgi:curved DNA-binding protein
VNKEPDAGRRFSEVAEAYEVLKDPEKRAAYDQLGADWRAGQEFRPPPGWERTHGFQHGRSARSGPGGQGAPEGFAQFSDFFAELFGGGASFAGAGGPGAGAGGRGFVAPGADARARVEIELDEAYRGATRNLELRSGDGIGTRTLKVTIPPGVTAGQRIRLPGQGGPGLGGGPAGDLYLEIAIRPHRAFELDGRNVTLTLPVAPWEAAFGETVSVPTLGGAVEMKLPAGARAGQVLRLRNRGLPGSPPGDQFVRLQIVLPPESAATRRLLEQLKAEAPFDPRAGLL